jgi:hypothetical protein
MSRSVEIHAKEEGGRNPYLINPRKEEVIKILI